MEFTGNMDRSELERQQFFLLVPNSGIEDHVKGFIAENRYQGLVVQGKGEVRKAK